MNPKVEIRNGPIGWGFFAKEEIENGEEIIRVNRQDQITISNMTATLEGAGVGVHNWNELENKPDCLDTLTMFLILEKQKGESSYYYDYINTLPTEYNTGKHRIIALLL